MDPKDHPPKLDKIQKDFELYQVFMHNFIGLYGRIFPLYILLKRTINRFWSKGFNNFDLVVSSHFKSKKSFKKNWPNFQVLIHDVLYQNVSTPPNHILLTRTKSIFTNTRFYAIFYQQKLVLLLFYLLTWTNTTILLDALLIQQKILFLRIFGDKNYRHLLQHMPLISKTF